MHFSAEHLNDGLTIEERARYYANQRWVFAKMFVEPHLRAASHSEDDPTVVALLPNHEYLIRSHARAQLIVKCRKTAHSWCIALDALCRAATEPHSDALVISYDEAEARDKNRFVEWIYAVLPSEVRRDLSMTDGQEERRFANGSRIKFLPRKAPVGAGATVYVDEFALEGRSGATAAEILVAAIGCTTHGGYIRLGGTQRGPHTLFNKLATGEHLSDGALADGALAGLPAVQWEVGYFPWWSSPALCIDSEAASRLAPGMTTAERVRRFGNDKLKIQYVTYCQTPELGEEIFQREFECIVLDEKQAYYPLALVRACYPAGSTPYWYAEGYAEGARQSANATNVINRVAQAIRLGVLHGEWGAAMDVGRDHDRSVIAIGHNLPEDRSVLALRALIVLENVPSPQQRELWDYLQTTLPIRRGAVDTTKGSIGRMFGEEANLRYGNRSECFEFTPTNRQIVYPRLKGRMERAALLLPDMREQPLERELLSIRRVELPSGNVTYEAARGADGHADRATALVMLSNLFELPGEARLEALSGDYNRLAAHGQRTNFVRHSSRQYDPTPTLPSVITPISGRAAPRIVTPRTVPRPSRWPPR